MLLDIISNLAGRHRRHHLVTNENLHKRFARSAKFAVNLEDVREFLYHFERSSIMQYYILSQYKARMLTEGSLISKEIKDKESGQREQKDDES